MANKWRSYLTGTEPEEEEKDKKKKQGDGAEAPSSWADYLLAQAAAEEEEKKKAEAARDDRLLSERLADRGVRIELPEPERKTAEETRPTLAEAAGRGTDSSLFMDRVGSTFTARATDNSSRKPALEDITDADRKAHSDYVSSLRKPEEIRADIDAAKAELSDARKQWWRDEFLAWGGGIQGRTATLEENDRRNQEIQDRISSLENELRIREGAERYDSLRLNPDFAQKSAARELTVKDRVDDPLYAYINGDRTAALGLLNPDDAISGRDDLAAEFMTPDEVRTYNYIHATEGREAAEEYVDFLRPELNARQSEGVQGEAAAWAGQNPGTEIAASVLSVPAGALRGVSYAGQARDYLTTGRIDENAPYNLYSKIPSAARDAVSKDVERKWGKAGSFAYQTGMSMADFLFNSAISGGTEALSLGIMGAGAAADAVLAAKDRGLGDTQSFVLGTIAGAAEIVSEKVSVEALFKDPDWRVQPVRYILKNLLAEGGEEVESDVINWLADSLVARDKSEWNEDIRAYKKDHPGATDSEAFWAAVKERAIEGGMDFLGGAISGGLMAGGRVAFDRAATAAQRNRDRSRGIEAARGALAARNAAQAQPTVREEAPQAQGAQEGGIVLPTAEEAMGGAEASDSGAPEARDGAEIRMGTEAQSENILPTADEAELDEQVQNARNITEATGIRYGVDKATIRRAERYGRLTGNTVEFYSKAAQNGTVENGFMSRKTGRLYYNVNAKNPFGFTFGHELTHTLEGTDAYQALSDYALSRLTESGADLDARRAGIRALYERAGNGLASAEEIDQEIVADWIGENLSDTAAIREICRKDPSVGKRIRDALDNFVTRAADMGGIITKYEEDKYRNVVKAYDRYLGRRQEAQLRKAEAEAEMPAQAETAAPVQTEQAVPAAGEAVRTAESDQAAAVRQGETAPGEESVEDYRARMASLLDAGEIDEEQYDAAMDLADEAESMGGFSSSTVERDEGPEGKIPAALRNVRDRAAGRKYSVSEADETEYSRLEAAGDEKTAQRMVDRAAEAAGYRKYEYEYVDRISPSEIEPRNAVRRDRLPELEDRIGKTTEWTGRPILVAKNGDSYIGITGSHRLYIAQQAGIDVDAVVIGDDAMQDLSDYLEDNTVYDLDEFLNRMDEEQQAGVLKDAVAEGYDSLRDAYALMVVETESNYSGHADQLVEDPYIKMDGEGMIVKSADPFTYDNEGKAIPLGERFNDRESDIRYSVSAALEKKVKDSDPVGIRDEVRASISLDPKYQETAEKKNRQLGNVNEDVLAKAGEDRAVVREKLESVREEANLPPDVLGNTAFANGAYGTSEESTSVCPRSTGIDSLTDAVAEQLGRPLTVEESVFVAQEAFNFTDMPECLYCYVSMDRKAKRELLGEYVKKQQDVIANLESGMSEEEALDIFRASETSGGKQWSADKEKRFREWAKRFRDGGKLLQMSDMVSEAAVEKAMRDPELRSQAKDAMRYAQSASWAKKRVGYAAYNGHILRWPQSKIDTLNSMFGLRMYSFSDYSPAFVLENMQMVTDAAVRGLKMLAYTKELDFVRVFAPTGMNINISVFGMDGQNGEVHQDAMQGADWKAAQALRDQFENVGCTFVATNDAQVEWALDQDWIDNVIPYHMVKTGARVAEIFGYHNYTGESADRRLPGATAKEIYSNQHQNDRETYFQALKEAGLTPRFERWAEHPNYMKLVKETRRSAGDTPAVQPIFDVDAAITSIDGMVARGGYNQPIGGSLDVQAELAEEMADKIARGMAENLRIRNGIIVDEAGNRRYSVSEAEDKEYMAAVEAGDTETAQRMVDEAAKRAGYTRAVFHGTGEYFNAFRRGGEGIHIGNRDVAEQVAKIRYEHRSKQTDYKWSDVKRDLDNMDATARDSLANRVYILQDYFDGSDEFPYDGDLMDTEALRKYLDTIMDRYSEAFDDPDPTIRMNTYDRQVGEHLMELYAKINNPMVINGDAVEWTPYRIASMILSRADGKNSANFVYSDDLDLTGFEADLTEDQRERLQYVMSTYNPDEQEKRWDILADVIGEMGYDGIQYLNKYEGDKNNWSYIALRPSDIKSADPVTYDDDGEPISLSDRFNPAEDDIRRSVSEAAEDPQTLTKNFKNWFGDWQSDPDDASKVVDENGRPKRMYHGTNADADFYIFNTYGAKFGLYGGGSYFTDNPDIANSYTKKGRGTNPRVYAVYLNIRNPMVMEAPADFEQWADAYPPLEDLFPDRENPETGEALTNRDLFKAMERNMEDEMVLFGKTTREAVEEVMDIIKSMGYDGINHVGGMARGKGKTIHDVWIAFDPTQIKSAIGNRGTFDPEDGDIRRSVSEAEDEEYMAAVEAGDTETAQRMVDEAARANGYTRAAFHGTGEYFNVFRRGPEGIHLGNREQAEQVARMRFNDRSRRTNYTWEDLRRDIGKMDEEAREDLAHQVYYEQGYMNETGEYRFQDPYSGDLMDDEKLLGYLDTIMDEYTRQTGEAHTNLWSRTYDRPTGENVMELYAKINNPLYFNHDMMYWSPQNIARALLEHQNGEKEYHAWQMDSDKSVDLTGWKIDLREGQKFFLQQIAQSNKYSEERFWDIIADVLADQGYDGIEYLNEAEGDENSSSFIALRPSDVKSADPVTYDDEGNVIPLSERFNSAEDDIRRSVSETEPEERGPIYALPMQARNAALRAENVLATSMAQAFGLESRRTTEAYREFRTEAARPIIEAMIENRDIDPDEIFAEWWSGSVTEGQEARDAFDDALTEAWRKIQRVNRFAGEQRAAEEARARRNAEIDAQIPDTADDIIRLGERYKAAKRERNRVLGWLLLSDEDLELARAVAAGNMAEEEVYARRPLDYQDILEAAAVEREFREADAVWGRYTRRIAERRFEQADRDLLGAEDWKDKGSGFAYARETPERNFRDVAGSSASALIDDYIRPIHKAEAESTRMKNEYIKRVADLKLDRKVRAGNAVSEAAAVQWLGEAMDNIRYLETMHRPDAWRDGMTLDEWRSAVEQFRAENPDLDYGKIERGIEEFKKIYDELITRMNQVLVENGYLPVNVRRGYFPHFNAGDDGILQKFAGLLGINIDSQALPTAINGLTNTFKPGKTWFGHAQERTGFRTDYDAVQGFDGYIGGVADVIHQTANIRNLRALATRIRYQFGDEGIKKRIDEINADDSRSETEKLAAIHDLTENGRYKLSRFVAWLDEYTNLLANKKSRYDRGIEDLMGRKIYTWMKNIEGRVASNMISANLGSALTNFIPLNQAGAMLGDLSMLRGAWDTVIGRGRHDGFVRRSDFLTNRRGTDPLIQNRADRISEFLSSPMNLIDNFVSETIVRAAYGKNLRQGMDQQTAMDMADELAAGIMADRSKGAQPTIFGSRNPLMKLFTQFQVEVNNEFSTIFKDIPKGVYRNDKDRKRAVAVAAWTLLRYFVGAYLFNDLYEKIVGRRAALDPLDLLNDAVGDFTGAKLNNIFGMISEGIVDEGERANPSDAILSLAGNTAEELPFVGGLLGGGRIPISSALPDMETIVKGIANEDWSKEKKVQTVGRELGSSIGTYILPPFAGGAIKKAVQTAETAAAGGRYVKDAEGRDQLQYPFFNDTPGEAARSLLSSALFGPTSTEPGREWVEGGFGSQSAKNTEIYRRLTDELGESQRASWEFVRSLGGQDAQGKRDAVAASGLSEEGKAEAMAAVVSDSESAKFKASGVSADAWAGFFGVLPEYDEDGNGSYKQAEVTAALDNVRVPLSSGEGAAQGLFGGDTETRALTRQEKAAIWSAYNPKWKVDNNPFDTAVGEMVVSRIGQGGE